MASHFRSVFGKLEIRLDPWQPEFGPEFSGMVDASASVQDSVDAQLERPAAAWGAVDPTDGYQPQSITFIDGVRRLEARVTAKADGLYHYGAFGSYAVGCVRLSSQEASFERFVTGRVLALSSPDLPEGEVEIAKGQTYLPVRVAETEADAPLREIHGQMRRAEESLAREMASEEDRLVVVDGPLTFEEKMRGFAVGYIKRVMNAYLGREQLQLLADLKPGQRTPLFALRGSQRFSRISCFLRLDAPRRGDSDFSGVVRLEVAESVGLVRAQELVSACAKSLPALKGRRALDRRAPQNLLPISALESFLRRRLGDERIARRRIETFLAREAV